MHRQLQPPRRRERVGSFIDPPLGDELVVTMRRKSSSAALRLHPRGKFLRKRVREAGRFIYLTTVWGGYSPPPPPALRRGVVGVGVYPNCGCYQFANKNTGKYSHLNSHRPRYFPESSNL